MFKKVLVANRGEIAVRVIRTLREMGIRTVAIYSEADRNALHVRVADEAYPVGPAPSAQSYLVMERILEVCQQAAVDAVHPGYGFLSENAKFVRACEKAGITFIGPSAEAMEAMGSKTAAREKMVAAGVPVVPGSNAGTIDELRKAAEKVGYPVMLKASAGGGGKGMRLVMKADELESAFDRARGEAKSSFGDETVYLEKAIIKPRHVEIQVLGDKHGNVVHLFERDCSVQRRHQKVVEETPSPSPVRTPALIEKMGEVAVQAAKAVGYFSAGTIEFLLAEDGSFYFLEMNTRLQVEHPITELITGIDLVREMVRIADGEKLGYTQKDVQHRGHAIECRIYAEDPATNFMPSPGKIEILRVPSGPGVRDDAGCYEGVEISMFYDPLISKLSVWAPTRALAVQRMARALNEYVVCGIKTNISFHINLMNHADFKRGVYDTSFIERNKDALLKPAGLPADAQEAFTIAAAVAVAFADEASARSASAGQAQANGAGGSGLSAWRIGAIARL